MKKRCEHDNLTDGIFPASSASTSAEVSFTNTLASLRAPLPLSRLRMVPAAVLLTLSLGACGGGSDTAPPNPESGMPPGTQRSDAGQATGTPAASASSQATNNNENNPSSDSSAGSTVTNNTQNSSGSNTTNATNTATGGSTGTTGNASGGTAQTNTSSPTPTAGTQSGNGTSTGGTAQSPATPAPGATGTPPATGTQPTPAPTNTINQQPAPVDTSNPATGVQSGGATQAAPANSGITNTQTPASPAPGGASTPASDSGQSNPTPAGTTGQQTTPTATNTPANGSTQASGTTPTNGTQTPDASAGGAAAQQPPATNTDAQTNATSQTGSATGGGNTGSTGTGTPADTTAQGGSTQPPAAPDGGQNTNQPPAPFPPVSESVCKDILAGNLPLPVGMNKLDMPDVPRPDVGVALKDEQHNSCVVRITDQAGKNAALHWRHASAGRQAFNADGSLLLLSSHDWKWRIHDARTGEVIKELQSISGKAEPHWHPSDPKRIHLLPREGLGMKLYVVDVEKDSVTELSDMSAAIRQHWPDATHAWTHASGIPSANHRYWCLLAEKREAGQNMPLGLFTWDLQENRIVGQFSPKFGIMPSRVSTSPSGEFCMTSAAYPDGAHVYRRDFSAPFNAQTPENRLQVNADSYDNPSDIVLNTQGEDVYVGTSYASSTGAVFAHNLKTGERKTLFDAYVNGTTTGNQISGLGHLKPGWVLISSYGDHDGSYNLRGLRDDKRQWMHRRVFALNLDNPTQVHAIAYLRSDYENGWQNELLPNTIVSPDFTRVLFNSSWDSNRQADVDTYMVEIPPSAIPAN